jgi:phage-related protein
VSAEITQWVDPFGQVTTLDVDWDATGRFMPPISHEEDEVPGQPGGRHRASRHKIKEFTIKVTISAADEPSLRQAVRDLVTSMNPARSDAPGAIRVTSPIGDVREIPCYYSAGLDMAEQVGTSGPTMQTAPITFRAYEPYWRDLDSMTQVWTVGATPSFFPFFPLRLTSSQIAASGSINLGGDVETWPVWTITGPGAQIVLRNLTTGDALTFTTTSLGIGESITIDARPGRKTVAKQDGTNVFSDLDITSVLWSLRPGNNAIRLEMSGTQSFAAIGANALANPGFESGTSPWIVNAGTLAQSTSQPHSGSYSAQITPDGTSTLSYVQSEPTSVVPGQPVSVAAWVWCTNATPSYSTSVNWLDSNRLYLDTSSNPVSVPAQTYTRVQNTFSAPANAAYARIVPTISDSAPITQTWYVDDCELRPSVPASSLRLDYKKRYLSP